MNSQFILTAVVIACITSHAHAEWRSLDSCKTTIVNRALRQASGENLYPQFDVQRGDGLNNSLSWDWQDYTETDPASTEVGGDDAIRHQLLFVSSVYRGRNESAHNFGGLERSVRSGERAMVHAVYWKREDDDDTGCSYDHTFAQGNYYTAAPASRRSSNSDVATLYPVAETLPPTLSRPPQAGSFFTPCERASVNRAIAAIVQDERIPSMSPHQDAYRWISLLGFSRQADTYVVSLSVHAGFVFTLANTYTYEGVERGEECELTAR